MPRAGTIDVVKERQWRGIIRDWQESGLSMAAYCQREKIKLGLLSSWCSKIRARDYNAANQKRNEPKGASRYRSGKSQGLKTQPAASTENESVSFAPVHVIDDSPSTENAQPPVLDVALACGIVLRLRDNCSMTFLVKVVNSLEGRDV